MMHIHKTVLFVSLAACGSGLLSAQAGKIMAQKVVEEVKAAHPEITGLELAATRSAQEGCKTIAATEAKETGEKCDKDEMTAMKTNQPFVEKEKDEFDVTVPLHDASGKIIGTAGMDFKVDGQTKESVSRVAKAIAAELEKRFPTQERLFEPAR